MSEAGRLTTADVAARVGVTAPTLRRWVGDGLIPTEPDGDGGWNRQAISQARVVARLRKRGHTLREIREATQSGRLAFGYLEDLLPSTADDVSLKDAARESGLEPALIERIYQALGFNAAALQRISTDDVQLLRYVAAALDAGLPLVAFLQLARVFGQALAQMADAEVRLFHLYVHEPLMREGVGGLEMAEEMEGLARTLLPLVVPVMDHVHRRFLSHFVEQDVVGHMESDIGDLGLGRLRVAIAFADLAGYTRMTEEEGEQSALDAVERFVDAVESSLPDGARVIKTIGDEVMIVSGDLAGLTDWAVDFQQAQTERPMPRIGIHAGAVTYRDGDYYGREVNLASRVAARSAGGEVVVTRPLVDAGGADMVFTRIGEVRLKGFQESTELFVAARRSDG